jgi:hypothetical protein
MVDVVAWLDLHAGAVQGVTAVGIFLLTIVLAAATVWYAKSAKEQVDELVRARLATIKPHMHVVGSSHGGTPDGYLVGFVIKADLTNLGSGPAIDLLARLEHQRLKFSAEARLATTAVSDTHTVGFLVAESSTDIAKWQELMLVAEYSDLAGNWWTTRAPARLGFVVNADGTVGQPSVSFYVQDEEVKALPKPTMQGTLAAVDVTRTGRSVP